MAVLFVAETEHGYASSLPLRETQRGSSRRPKTKKSQGSRWVTNYTGNNSASAVYDVTSVCLLSSAPDVTTAIFSVPGLLTTNWKRTGKFFYNIFSCERARVRQLLLRSKLGPLKFQYLSQICDIALFDWNVRIHSVAVKWVINLAGF